jgi:hypothetical protein
MVSESVISRVPGTLDSEKRPSLSESASRVEAVVPRAKERIATNSTSRVVGVLAGSRIAELDFLYESTMQQAGCTVRE